jgi:hypothetical protein
MMRTLKLLREITGDLIDLAVSLGLSISICYGLLYFGKSLWWVYVQTPVGQEYLRMFSKDAAETFRLYDHDLLQLAVQVHWFVVRAALLVGAMSQALYLTSQFYDNTDGLKRLLRCVAPFVGFSAWHVHMTMALGWFPSLVLVVLASLFLLEPSMRLTSRVLPDGILLRIPLRMVAECVRFITVGRGLITNFRCQLTRCPLR